MSGRYEVAPLSGKYYSTRIVDENGILMAEVWGHGLTGPSPRERETEFYDDHYETAEAYAMAQAMVWGLNNWTGETDAGS